MAVPPGSAIRVLLVEDNLLHTQLITSVLSRLSYEVVAVDRLSEGLRCLTEGEFAAILLDLELPDSEGLATLRAVTEPARNCPIIVITAYDDAQHALDALSAGAADYLVKGRLDAQTMVRAIRYAIERKRAEQKLIQSEARFRAIIENATDAVIGMTANGLVVDWNPAAVKMFGYTRDEAIGREVAELIIPHRFREAHRTAIAQYQEAGVHRFLDRRVEMMALRRDGTEFPIDLSITSSTDENGLRFSAFIVDITERRHLQETREALGRRFRALVEHSADGIMLLDASGIILYTSPAVTRILGYSSEEIVGTDVFDYLHSNELPVARHRFAEALAGAPPDVYANVRFRHRDGTWRHLNAVRSNCLDDPAIRAIVINIRDMTDLRRSKEALLQLREKYELILNTLGAGVCEVDKDNRIRFANPAAVRMLGWPSAARLEGRPAHPTLHHAYADGTSRVEDDCPILQTLRDSVERDIQIDTFWRKDGSSFPVKYSVTPLSDRAGNATGAVVAFTDMTKQKEMEAQVEQAMRVSSLGRVAASVAHEFNNVLMAIQPFAELLQKRVGEADNVQKPVRHILEAIKRGQRMTTQILRFTRPADPRMETVNASDWMTNFSDEARPMLIDRNVLVDVEPDLLIQADVMQLHQVFVNFVANARHATTAGDEVTFGAALAGHVPFLRERVPEASARATLFVRDSGRGMSAEVLQHIFEPLYTTKKAGGTGLGLAVAHQVIAHHRGMILVDSQPNRGSTFYVVLPLAQAEAADTTDKKEEDGTARTA